MKEFSIFDIIKYYVKHFWIVLLVIIIMMGIGKLYINRAFVPLYEESVTIILGKGSDNDTISSSTITLYDSLIKNYKELLESNKLLHEVITELELNYTTGQLANMMKYSIYDSSQMVKISVKNENDALAVDICNKTVEILQKQVKEIYDLDNITVVDKATITNHLLYSKAKVFIIFIFIGFAVSSAIIIVNFIFSNSIIDNKNKNKEKELIIDVLGTLIYIRDKKDLKINLDTSEYEKHLLRNVRTNLFKNLKGKKTIMIASINDNISKSYVAFNLARAIAKTNKKVLLIDANSKDGIITKNFLKDKKGLTEAILNIKVLEDVKYKIDCIDIIPLGDRENIDLLLSSSFKELLEKLESEYDYIFIDTPAFIENFEPKEISKLIDFIVMVEKPNNKVKKLKKYLSRNNEYASKASILFVKEKKLKKVKTSIENKEVIVPKENKAPAKKNTVRKTTTRKTTNTKASKKQLKNSERL